MKNEPHWVKIRSPSYTRTAVPDLPAFRHNYCPLIASEYIQLRAHAEVDLGLRIHVRLKCNFDHSLGAFSRRDLKMFFSFFLKILFWRFMQIVSLHEMVGAGWGGGRGRGGGCGRWENINLPSAESAQRVVSIILLLCMLVNNFSRRHFEICFPFFAKK